MTAFYVIWRIWAFAIWFGVMFAVCSVIIAIALCAVLLAVLAGLLMPSRTVGGQLRSLSLNVRELVAQIQALDPRHPPVGKAG